MSWIGTDPSLWRLRLRSRSRSGSQWRSLLLLLLLVLLLSAECHGDGGSPTGANVSTNVITSYPTATPTPAPGSSPTSSPTSPPTPTPTRPPLLPRLLGSQPLYVASSAIGTSYPDVGVILMSWTYAQDLIINNRTVYTWPAQLAFRQFLEQGVFGSRMVRLELLDDGDSSQQAQKNLLTGLIADPFNSTALPLLGVLGSQAPGSSIQLMQLASTLDLVGMSAAPSFDWIMNKELYQTVAVTNVQYSRVVDAIFALCVTQNWRRMGVLGPQDDTFNTFLAYATTRYPTMNQYYGEIAAAYIAAVPSQASKYMFLLQPFMTSIQGLLKNQVTILIIATFDQHYGQVIYKALQLLGLLDNADYMIIGTGGWTGVAPSLLANGTVGSNILSLRSPPPDPVRYDNMVTQIINRTVANGYNESQQQQVYQALMDPNMIPILPYYYDMAYIMLSAVAQLYQSGVPFTSRTLYHIIQNSTFESPVTGTIQVDENGIVAAPIGIYQVIPSSSSSSSMKLTDSAVASNSSMGSWSLIGLYVALNPMSISQPDNDTVTAQQIETANHQFTWNRKFVYQTSDGTPPLDHLITAPASVWYTPTSLNHGIYGFTGTVTGLIVLLAMTVWWYRNTLLIRCTQLVWSLLLLLSLAVLAVSTVFYVLSPVDDSWLCQVRPWCTAMSLVCVLVTLLTKVNRIRYIYNNRDISSTREKQGRDTWIFSVLLLPQIVLLIAFSAAKLSTRTIFTSNNIGTNTYTILCTDLETTGWLIWFIFELIYICMLLLALLYMAFSIRHTPSAFNESHHLLSCVFALCVVLAILVPLQFIVNSDPSAVLLVRGIGQPLTALIITIILFGPKLRYLYTGRGNDSTLAEKYHVKGSPALQQDEGFFSSVMDTNEGTTQYPKHIQQHEYTALFLRCSHLEQQMQRIRALLLKCASDDNMVLNDDMLNLMFTISQLADDVALKHGPFSFSDTNDSSFESSTGAGPGAADIGAGDGDGYGYGYGVMGTHGLTGEPHEMHKYQDGTGTGTGTGLATQTYDMGRSLYPGDDLYAGVGLRTYAHAPSPALAPAPGLGSGLAAMAVAVKAGQLNPMQALSLPVHVAPHCPSFDSKPPLAATTGSGAAPPQTEPVPSDKPSDKPPDKPMATNPPASSSAPAPHMIRIASKTDTRHPASYATDTSSYLASRSASASASTSASASAAATPITETRAIRSVPTLHGHLHPSRGVDVDAAIHVPMSAVAPSSRYHSYVPSHHSFVSHSHAPTDTSPAAASRHSDHFGSSRLFAAKVHARKNGHPHQNHAHHHSDAGGSGSPAPTAATTTAATTTADARASPRIPVSNRNRVQPGAPNGSARAHSHSDSDSDSHEDSRSQVQQVSFWGD